MLKGHSYLVEHQRVTWGAPPAPPKSLILNDLRMFLLYCVSSKKKLKAQKKPDPFGSGVASASHLRGQDNLFSFHDHL